MATDQAPIATVLTAQAQGSGPTSQDRVVVLPNAVLVLDGASAPEPEPIDGGTYATALAERLAANLSGNPNGPLRDTLAASIDQVRRDLGLTPGQSPSSTVAILRWTSEQLDALVLGDSPIVIYGGGEPHVLMDDRLSRVAGTIRTRLQQRLMRGSGYDDEHLRLMRRLVAAEGEQRNVPDGYWIAEADPVAAQHAMTYGAPLDGVRAALMTTDGVSRGVMQATAVENWTGALALAEASGPEALAGRVRAAEEADPQGRHWPRSKAHDDKTIALVRFSTAAGHAAGHRRLHGIR